MSSGLARFELGPDPSAIQRFLDAAGWLEPGETVAAAAPAGAGNMNATVRVRTDRRSVVLKQSRPYCVKFPEIAAPIERLAFEVRFYEIARRSPLLAAHMPEVMGFHGEASIAMLEDLGEASDLLDAYGGRRIERSELETLCGLARALHTLPLADDERAALENPAMRALNHAHVFEIPLDPDAHAGPDLDAITPGLGALASGLRADDDYAAEVIALGMLYTGADGPCLLHGDFYPGSFLRAERGLCVIDPEFGFAGPAEFDLGVLAAHLVFAGAEQDVIDRIGAAYGRAFDRRLVAGFAGCELMRRLLGVAQLPLGADLERKRAWLELSHRWLTGRA